ncbi:MAG: hypothetical protein ABIQ16_21190 [Polyangiaceae bacterium]
MLTHPLHRKSVFLVLSACALALGCDQEGPRVYTAMPVNTDAHCLEPYTPLGLVTAEELPATCGPVCITRDDTLYVSEVCPPYPDDTTVVSPHDSSDCAAALTLIGVDGGGACERK